MRKTRKRHIISENQKKTSNFEQVGNVIHVEISEKTFNFGKLKKQLISKNSINLPTAKNLEKTSNFRKLEKPWDFNKLDETADI